MDCTMNDLPQEMHGKPACSSGYGVSRNGRGLTRMKKRVSQLSVSLAPSHDDGLETSVHAVLAISLHLPQKSLVGEKQAPTWKKYDVRSWGGVPSTK